MGRPLGVRDRAALSPLSSPPPPISPLPTPVAASPHLSSPHSRPRLPHLPPRFLSFFPCRPAALPYKVDWNFERLLAPSPVSPYRPLLCFIRPCHCLLVSSRGLCLARPARRVRRPPRFAGAAPPDRSGRRPTPPRSRRWPSPRNKRGAEAIYRDGVDSGPNSRGRSRSVPRRGPARRDVDGQVSHEMERRGGESGGKGAGRGGGGEGLQLQTFERDKAVALSDAASRTRTDVWRRGREGRPAAARRRRRSTTQSAARRRGLPLPCSPHPPPPTPSVRVPPSPPPAPHTARSSERDRNARRVPSGSDEARRWPARFPRAVSLR